MKNSNVAKTLTIAAVTALVLGIAPNAKAADKGCSTVSLLGTFSRRDTGTVLMAPAAAAVGPIAVVGTFTQHERFDDSAHGLG